VEEPWPKTVFSKLFTKIVRSFLRINRIGQVLIIGILFFIFVAVGYYSNYLNSKWKEESPKQKTIIHLKNLMPMCMQPTNAMEAIEKKYSDLPLLLKHAICTMVNDNNENLNIYVLTDKKKLYLISLDNGPRSGYQLEAFKINGNDISVTWSRALTLPKVATRWLGTLATIFFACSSAMFLGFFVMNLKLEEIPE
jgi:hypothetical protein